MRPILLFICLLMANIWLVDAQDTIVLNSQPNWTKPLDIADKSLFYQEHFDKPLSFDEAIKKPFVPYEKQFQKQVMSNRPLIIQWHKFIISNTSGDTIRLRVGASAHYFTRLYANQKLIVFGGAYETKQPVDDLFAMPLLVPPHTAVTYWVRNEDRQNQMVPPQLTLKTPTIDAKEKLKEYYGVRYLFLLMGVITGCLFFISVYAIYQYYLYRDVAFRWYIAYTVAAFFISLYWMDIRLHIMIFTPFVRDVIFSIFLYFVPVLYTFFIGSMLQLSVQFKKTWVLVKVLVAIAIFQMAVELVQVRTGWFMLPLDYYGIVLSVIPIAILNIVLLVLTAKSKDPVKWFLFSGLVSMLLLWCLGLTGFFARLPFYSFEIL